MTRLQALLAMLCVALLLSTGTATAQQAGPVAAPTTVVETQSLPPIAAPRTAAFDPQKATNAYLARIGGAARARSDAYFEGGYWLILVDTLYTVAVAALLLWLRVSASIRDFAERQTRSRFWQVPLYVGPLIIVFLVASFPLTLFEDFFRERAYGLMNQTFLQWFGDQLVGWGFAIAGGTIALTLIYAAIRAAPRNWWIWAAALAILFSAVFTMAYPVLVAPALNHYSPLPASPLKSDILSLARANGIPADNVYEVDASRQSDRISANVSGFLGTTRLTLNDNLLKKASHDEILAVLGHEMGHYVLDHVWYGLLLDGVLTFAVFAFLAWGFRILTDFFGGSWDVRRIEDPAGIPVLVMLYAVAALVLTPISNSITRSLEIQADMYGLNAARKPDAFATVVLKLSNYRKLDPSPLEEFVFYDHPSGRTRIWEAMRWKAEHLKDPDIAAGPVSPQ